MEVFSNEIKSACFCFRGADIGSKDVGSAAKQIEKGLEAMDLEDDEEDDDLPIFTPELAKLK